MQCIQACGKMESSVARASLFTRKQATQSAVVSKTTSSMVKEVALILVESLWSELGLKVILAKVR